MTYGYKSDVAFSQSTAGVEDFAIDLLARLEIARKDKSKRPIIFICHSMGGLIVKKVSISAFIVQSTDRYCFLIINKALILAHDRQQIYNTIAESKVGIVFLATPHQGSGLAALGQLACKLLRACGMRANKKLVTCLRQDADILWDISCQFVERSAEIYIKSFYETECLPFLTSLVRPSLRRKL